MSWSYALTACASPFFWIGDFDGDGNPDLIWLEQSFASDTPGSLLRIAHGNGSGVFSLAPTVFVAPVGEFISTIADLDSDGKTDLVLSGYSLALAQPIPVVYGVPAGSTPTVTGIPTPFASFVNTTVVDLDHDEYPDIVVEGNFVGFPYSHPIVVFRGRGSRQFSAPFLLLNEFVEISVLRIFAADMDGDRDSDLVRSVTPFLNGPTTFELLRNEAIHSAGCSGTGGSPPSLWTGVASPGNAAFAIGLHGAAPGATAVLGISQGRVPGVGCGVAIDLAPSQLILPLGSLGVTATNVAGNAVIAFPLPPPPALAGLVLHVQWAVDDPQGTFTIAGHALALSAAHTILIW